MFYKFDSPVVMIRREQFKATRIKKIKDFGASTHWGMILVEYQPIKTIQSFQEPFDEFPKKRSSIWTSFDEVYRNHKQLLTGYSY